MPTRKLKNSFYLLITMLVPLLVFISCSEDDSPTNVVTMDERLVGNWTLTKVTIPSFMMEQTPEEAGFMINGEVNSDGTFEMRTVDSTGTSLETGEWQTSGTTLTLCYEDGTSLDMAYTVDNNVITVITLIEMEPGQNVEAKLEFLKE